jgi:SagB-type dehydrogenase family enzyme
MHPRHGWIRVAAAAFCVVGFSITVAFAGGCGETAEKGVSNGESELALTEPETSGGMPLNEAISKRRSRRSFSSEELTAEQISQILWAAQGVTDRDRGYRTAPSAGALYPLEIYFLQEGILRNYEPGSHSLKLSSEDVDVGELAAAASNQQFVAAAPVVFVMTADFQKTRNKYGDKAERYVCMEAGHAAQNLLLEATGMGLGAVTVGAFDDARVKSILQLPAGQEPLYLIPVGHATD